MKKKNSSLAALSSAIPHLIKTKQNKKKNPYTTLKPLLPPQLLKVPSCNSQVFEGQVFSKAGISNPKPKDDQHPLPFPQGKARKQAESKPPQLYRTHLSACQQKSPRIARLAASYPRVYSWRRLPRSYDSYFGAQAKAHPHGARSPLPAVFLPLCWHRHGPSHKQCPYGPWRTRGGQPACRAQWRTRTWRHKEVDRKASWESASKLSLSDLDLQWKCTHLY